MAIQFPSFDRITFDQANPFLTGMAKGQKLTQNTMKFPQDLQAAILANQIAKVKAQYAPQDIQSQIGLRGAETNLYQSQAGMGNLKLQYLQNLLGGGGGGNGGTGNNAPSSPNTSGGNTSTPTPNYNAGLMSGGNPQNNYDYDSQGNNIKASPADAANVAQFGNGAGASSSPASQGESGSAPSVASPQSSNSMYGIEVPQPTHSDMTNSMLLGMDTFSPKRDNAKAQIQDQYNKYQDAIAQSIQEANSATNMNQALNIFNNAMDRSTFKGQNFGHIESSGLLTPPFLNMSPEQEADRAASQMIPTAVATLKDAMGSSRFSNLDMQMASRLKFDRTMNDETRQLQTNWIHGVNERMQEKSKFYSLLGNPKSGAQKSVADQLWQNYQDEFQLISKNGKTFQGENLGNWPLFTTPKAIAAIKNNGFYKPTSSERNTFMMKLPSGKVVPIKKGRVESAFRKGARPL